MKMIKYHHKLTTLLLACFFTISFIACDVIDEEDRLIVDNTIPEKPEKTVLLEDFTGYLCVNCPTAAEEAHKIQKRLGEKMIIVSIHAGVYAQSSPEYQSEAGNAYLNRFYPEPNGGYPAGMISRKQVDGSLVHTNFLKWETYVMERLNSDFLKGRMFEFSISPQYIESSNEIIVSTDIESHNALSGVHLQLWITESGIVGNQLTSTGYQRDYVHNHMLRDAINGIWGEELEAMEENSEVTLSNTYSLEGKTWDVNNLSIVGFIYDSKTMEVLHVVEKSLIDTIQAEN